MKRLIGALALGATMAAGMAPSAFAADAAGATAQQAARCARAGDLQNWCLSAYSVPSLRLPTELRVPGVLGVSGAMAIYKPDGKGPFPAIVLLHTCGSIVTVQTAYWVKAALSRGFAAFVLDSWTQRNLPNGSCDTRPEFNTTTVRLRDAYEALDRLASLPEIDASRVAVMGFSHGGRMTYLLANRGVESVFSLEGRHFAAAVSVYGECYNRPTKFAYLRPNVDAPLLALLGGRDEDGDPSECLPRLQAAKDKGGDVEWHVFPNAGHAWDQPNFAAPQRKSYSGSPNGTVLYAYDAKVTDESRDLAFAFLAKRLAP